MSSEGDAEATVFVSYDGRLAATASLAANVVKEVAVDPSFEGEGLAAVAVSRIIAEAHALGRTLLRVFTAPKNEKIFTSLGFRRLAAAGEDAVLLESDRRAFERWAAGAKAEIEAQVPASAGASGAVQYGTGAVVVNCNPFTRGHRSLIERAASRCGLLVVFVLEADKSSFPAEVRYRLVREGTADIPNAAVIKSGPYVISEATFPTYFIKEKSRATEIHTRLDVTLFATRIAPALGIQARFMGTEPYCPVTSLYNQTMKEILPAHGVAAEELERVEAGGTPISASAVRAALKADDWSALGSLVPETTLAYLRSVEAAEVIERIKAGTARH